MDVGGLFPSAILKDIDGEPCEFPEIFTRSPATVVFFYRGRF
jgi:hypothetical protein